MNIYIYIYIYIYILFTTESFLEVAIESWPQWDGFEHTTTKFWSGALTD